MRLLLLGAGLLLGLPAPGQTPQQPKPPVFLLHQIGTDHSEAVAVLDVDGDGRLDVTSGAFWYRAPEWDKTGYRDVRVRGELVDNCAEFAFDVNGDGLLDIITAAFSPDGIFYYQNPGRGRAPWKKVLIAESRRTESILLEDLDGDGKPDILPCHMDKQPGWWLRNQGGGFERLELGPMSTGSGCGVGDVDGDGLTDILGVYGWYRQVNAAQSRWEYHADWDLFEAGIAMAIFDVNGDGLTDVIHSKGHNYGLYWMEQKKDGAGRRSWVNHVIDDSFSCVHTMKLVDLDGDGRPEILAGKRYRPHNEKDPGAFEPLAIFYYTIEPGRQPKFTRHPVAYNSIAGAGMQFVVIDLDGDSDLDIVVGGKTGQYWFENLSVDKVPPETRDLLFNRYPARR